MTSRRIAFAAAVLFYLVALFVDAQVTQQALIHPTQQTKQQLTKALQEYREKKDGHGEAIALLQLGMAEVGLGNVVGAKSNLAEAVEKMRAENDPVGAWLALNILAQIEVALGRPGEAIPHLEKAFVVLNEAKNSTTPFTLKTFLAFGSVSGLPPEMLQALDGPGAQMMRVMMIQYSFEPMTHDQYGSVLTHVGQLQKAEAELKAAVSGAVYSQGLYDFSIEAHFGDLRFRQQRYDDARSHYMKALNGSSKTATLLPMGGDEQIKADIYDRLMRLETITGHPDEAKRWSEKKRELSGNRTGSR